MASRKVAFAVPEIQASREKPSSKKSPHFLERTHNPGFGFLDSSSESEDGRPRKRPKLLDNEPLSMSLSTISRMKRVSKLSSTPFATFSKNHQANLHSYRYSKDPPSPSELLESFDAYRLPCKVYQDPYFSKKADAPDRRREYAGLIFYIKGGDGVSTLEEWDSQDEQKEHLYSQPILRDGNGLAANDVWGWEYANTPPSFKEVSRWMQEEGRSVLLPERSEYLSQVRQSNMYDV